MCGLTGIFNLQGRPVDPAHIDRMKAVLAHRGPDSEGAFCHGPIGLGHRRLAILDLSEAGHQPMATEDGRWVLVYNGEIYNFKELRQELEILGVGFRSRTDTEVVLKALVEWGDAALNRFNGMFALALWDRREETLFLARDRYGIKPLYHSLQGKTFLFGSEVKAIREYPAFRTAMDREGLLEYMTFQNFFTDRTLFEGVRLLPAGCSMRVSAQGVETPKRYWDYDFREPEQPEDDQAYLEELDRLFCQAVRRQLVSDVEVGAYLSGGVDSGSITARAAMDLPYMKSFTCGFDLSSASGMELGFDERAAAEAMSHAFKTEHYEIVLKAGDMERVLPRLTRHLEEPRVGQSYPNFYIAQLTGKFVKVVLSGTGGDELFGGYPWRYYRAVVNSHFEQYIDKYYLFWQRLIPNKEIRSFFSPIWNDVQQVWTRDLFRDVFDCPSDRLSTPEEYVNHSLYFEAKTFLHGLLVVEDKISMAHSLETRVPFLDNDLVDFAMNLPVRLKLGNLDHVVRLNENEPGPKTARYFNKTKDGKRLLRQAMQRHVPKAMAAREKQGFSAPDASWFKGESIDYVRRKLYHPEARIYEFFDRDAVQRLVNEHLEGRQNRRLLIWSLLTLENWCEAFLV